MKTTHLVKNEVLKADSFDSVSLTVLNGGMVYVKREHPDGRIDVVLTGNIAYPPPQPSSLFL